MIEVLQIITFIININNVFGFFYKLFTYGSMTAINHKLLRLQVFHSFEEIFLTMAVKQKLQ